MSEESSSLSLQPLAAGDIADIFLQNGALVKIARRPEDRIFLDNEANNLEIVRNKLPKDTWRKAVPEVRKQDVWSGRRVNVMNYFDGFLTAEQIRQAVPKGVQARTIVWMWKRFLIFTDWLSHVRISHAAVLPPHVMFFPDSAAGSEKKDERKHSIKLVDWCYSRPRSEKLAAWCPQWKAFYPPEALNQGPVGPWTDLYMGAKTMIYLAGGDPETNSFPSRIPLIIQSEIQECLVRDLSRRPVNASQYHDRFSEVCKNAFGENSWFDFELT